MFSTVRMGLPGSTAWYYRLLGKELPKPQVWAIAGGDNYKTLS